MWIVSEVVLGWMSTNKVNIGSGNDLVPAGNKPLSEPLLTNMSWYGFTGGNKLMKRIKRFVKWHSTNWSYPCPSGIPHISGRYLQHFQCNCFQANAARPHWWLINIGSGNGKWFYASWKRTVFYTPVWKTDVLCLGNVRPSVCPSVKVQKTLQRQRPDCDETQTSRDAGYCILWISRITTKKLNKTLYIIRWNYCE